MDDASHEDGISLASGDEEDDEFGGDDDELAGGENRAVAVLRISAAAVWLLAAVTVSALVHHTSKQSETVAFEAAFRDASLRVADSVRELVGRTLGAMDNLAVDVQSYAHTSGSQWPMVTLPDFEQRSEITRGLSDADFVMLVPLVQGGVERSEWEQYTVDHQAWLHVADSERDVPLSNPFEDGAARVERSLGESRVSRFIFNESGRCVGDGPFAPLWETSPVVPGLADWINFDALSVPQFRYGFDALRKSRMGILAEVVVAGNESAAASYGDHWLDTLVTSSGSVTMHGPTMSVLYPVLSNETTLVAALVTVSPWSRHFSNVLSPNIRGVDAVLRNGCGQTETFRISGALASHLGSGDLHEPRYDSMSQSFSIDTSTNETGPALLQFMERLDRDYCPYTVSFYPSDAMRQTYSSWSPFMNTVAVWIIFGVAALVFLLLDSYVERRHKVVIEQALQSTAIVSSLFPETVRERLFRRGSLSEDHGADDGSLTVLDETPAGSDPMSSMIVAVQPAKMRLKSFLNDVDDGGASAVARPIADLFPRCTVLFADISGFTGKESI
jgi:ABC-type glycerol-3-phosphate transport system permease component